MKFAKTFRYTHQEARNLIKLETVQEFLSVFDECVEDYANGALEVKKPFKKLDYGGYGSADVYINRKDNVVVKIEGTAVDLEKVPLRAIPTAFGFLHGRLLRIQPVANVNRKNQKDGMRRLNRLSTRHTGFDLREPNVGKYKNKFVVIDW